MTRPGIEPGSPRPLAIGNYYRNVYKKTSKIKKVIAVCQQLMQVFWLGVTVIGDPSSNHGRN